MGMGCQKCQAGSPDGYLDFWVINVLPLYWWCALSMQICGSCVVTAAVRQLYWS